MKDIQIYCLMIANFQLLLLSLSRARKDCGLTATLAQLRSNYYIIKARKLTKKILNNCLICKRDKVKAFLERTAPLPADRMNMCAAFDVTGIEFAGPQFIKELGSSKKACICLFTWVSVRSIHLELVSDLTTQTFILAFKRFIGSRGLCRTVYSDNAATFKKADKELQRWLNKKSELQEYFSSQKIEWKYIAPLASRWRDIGSEW
ncbi:uncharacterized protein [Parasteatoda tepidariorum]|uniref:uncharacterized protein n=1 Tax=Parasteatoda tepidariorum TaxID=114398 RepID=UPI001C7208C0|nr:uncharacterized protein LOC122268910 [Parasteatoda tepidariorum]